MASIKALKATAPQFMDNDGRAHYNTDKVILGAAPGLGVPAAGDTIDFRIPGGAQVASLALQIDDCDTGAAFVFSVGYRPVDPNSSLAPNATYFAAAGQTTGQAGGRLVCAFKPIKFEEDVYVQLVVGTAPAGIAGNPEIHMIAGYNCVGQK
ncbi:hypothetical protein RD110_15590 [Rhodoferax koreense]|uniref:Uncharacterized protein n=1 Tax=Rhodoferax koreensis TaxID=1842727 RepID=A0A1P8JXI7_9BURK|nr:hypothetical protein [Rhodoferax koreense]APW38445.1 hypothetical protein RD110_15590 [Rhodoferax koreense]